MGPQNGPKNRKPDVGYFAAHDRIKVQRGRASAHPCADCSNPAQEWSYNHDDPDELIHVHKRTGSPVAYSPDPAFYSPRCKSCHFKFDRRVA